MTPECLLELIKSGESLEVEFKGESKGAISDGDLLEAVVCMSNQVSCKEAMELCNLTRQQASALLRRMKEKGILRLVGKGRGAHYVLNE